MSVENFLKKNTKWVIIVLSVLFMFKTIQSCNRNMTIRSVEKRVTKERDSLIGLRNNKIEVLNLVIDSLNGELLTKEFLIKDLTTDLRIAGVKVNEAERRADAIQKTASSIKTNTTIEVKNSVDKDDDINEKNQ